MTLYPLLIYVNAELLNTRLFSVINVGFDGSTTVV